MWVNDVGLARFSACCLGFELVSVLALPSDDLGVLLVF